MSPGLTATSAIRHFEGNDAIEIRDEITISIQDCHISYPTVCPIPLYHGTGKTVHGNPLSHLRAPYIPHCPSHTTVPWVRQDHTCQSTVLSESRYVLFLSHSSPKYMYGDSSDYYTVANNTVESHLSPQNIDLHRH